MRFIKVNKYSTFNIHNPIDIRFLTRLSLNFEQKFQNNFWDTVSPICDCGYEIESTEHFLLHSSFTIAERNHPFKIPRLESRKDYVNNVNVLLFRKDKYGKVINVGRLKSTFTYLK